MTHIAIQQQKQMAELLVEELFLCGVDDDMTVYGLLDALASAGLKLSAADGENVASLAMTEVVAEEMEEVEKLAKELERDAKKAQKQNK